jgi:hypothetical protein
VGQKTINDKKTVAREYRYLCCRLDRVSRLNRRNTTAFRPWIRAVTLGNSPPVVRHPRVSHGGGYLTGRPLMTWESVGTERIPTRPAEAACPPQARRQYPEPVRQTSGSDNKPEQCRTAVSTRSTAESTDICRLPRGKPNTGCLNMTEERSTGGLALPAVPPVPVREHPVRFALAGCSVGLPNLKRPPLGSLRVHAQEDLKLLLAARGRIRPRRRRSGQFATRQVQSCVRQRKSLQYHRVRLQYTKLQHLKSTSPSEQYTLIFV